MLVETVKWGHPCYMHAGRNIVIIGAFRGDFRITFFNAALLTDPHGVLEKQGPNTRHRDMIRFADNAQVEAMAPVITTYLKEAADYAEAGILPPKDEGEVDLPGELQDALDADPELGGAFHRLTPGRQKSYVISLVSAKTAATEFLASKNSGPRSCTEKAPTSDRLKSCLCVQLARASTGPSNRSISTPKYPSERAGWSVCEVIATAKRRSGCAAMICPP